MTSEQKTYKQKLDSFVSGLENKLTDVVILAAWAVMEQNARRDKKCKGLKRSASSKCCAYCMSHEGTYTSEQVDAGAMGGRHEACKCKVTPVFEVRTKEQRKAKREPTTIHIGRSVGAKARNYTVNFFGKETRFVEGSDIIEKRNFAGKDSEPFRELRVRHILADKYGGDPEDWKHLAGEGWIFEPVTGKIGHAEVHWMQNDEIERYEDFVFKNWLKR